MDVRVGLQRKLRAEELMLLNRGVGKDSWELLDTKEITLVNFKVNQSWIYFGRIDVEAEAPILWPPDAKNQVTGKDPDVGKDWGQEKETSEVEMDGISDSMDMSLNNLWEMVMDREAWHAWGPWCRKESDMTEWLSSNNISVDTEKAF